MKPYYFIIFFIFFQCKSDIESNSIQDNTVENSVNTMWNNFTKANPEYKTEAVPDSWFFHDNKSDANRLAQLTLNGKKRASSGLYLWYKEANASLPKVGTKQIVTNYNGRAIAIIETKKVDTIPFSNITKAYAALDMGTTIEPLKKWKNAHWAFFTNALKESGKQPTQNMLVVCEVFETIWPIKK